MDLRTRLILDLLDCLSTMPDHRHDLLIVQVLAATARRTRLLGRNRRVVQSKANIPHAEAGLQAEATLSRL